MFPLLASWSTPGIHAILISTEKKNEIDGTASPQRRLKKKTKTYETKRFAGCGEERHLAYAYTVDSAARSAVEWAACFHTACVYVVAFWAEENALQRSSARTNKIERTAAQDSFSLLFASGWVSRSCAVPQSSHMTSAII